MSPVYTDPPFDIEKDGFKFENAFKNTIHLGPFGWSLRTSGRCGGISYAALDFFYSNEFERPDTGSMPPDGDVLADYILWRQIHTFESVADEYIAAMTVPGGSDIYYGRCYPPSGDGFKYYRRHILRKKKPCNVAGIAIGSGLPDVGNGHQMLGIGLSRSSDPEKVLIHVYDSNAPGEERVLRLNKAERLWELRAFVSGRVGDEVIRKFKAWFPDPGYRPQRPDLFEVRAPYVDKSNKDLRRWRIPAKQDLQNYILTRARFSGANVSSVDFEGVEATGAMFDGAAAKQCDFRSAKLDGASFAGADLRGSTFDKAHMANAVLAATELSDAKFRRAKLTRANLIGAKMNNTSVLKATMPDAMLMQLSAANSSFYGADLESAQFIGAALNNVSFEGATLTGASFMGASLRNCNFTGADLQRAAFVGIPVADSSFESANLHRADLRGAVLNTVDFCGANLRSADFRNVSIDHIELDAAVEFAGSRWSGAVLHDVSGLSPNFLVYLVQQGAAIR